MSAELTKTSFDYGDLPEPEQRAMERHATNVQTIQERIRKTTAEGVADLGRELEAAQERLANRGSGTFQAWVKERLGISKSNAYNAIASWRFLKDRPNFGRTFEPSALYLIAPESCPAPARAEALKIAESGKVVTYEIAKAIVERHAPKSDTSGYAPCGTGAKKRKAKESATAGGLQGFVERARDAGRSESGPVPVAAESGAGESPPAVSSPTVIETTARDVSTPPSAPASSEPTATDLLTALSPIVPKLRKVKEDLAGNPFDAKAAGQYAAGLVSLIEGEPPAYRLVKAGDHGAQAAEIYDIYPRKVGRDKALVAIRNALKRVGFDELREAVAEFAKSPAGNAGEFTPHPATWFGEGRWNDDRSEWKRDRNGRASGKAQYKPGPGERFDPTAELRPI